VLPAARRACKGFRDPSQGRFRPAPLIGRD